MEQVNNRVQKFTSNGAYLTQWGSMGSGNGQFNAPFGIAIDAAGNVYVADSGNHRIQKFTSNGAYLTQWGGLGSGNGQFNGPRGVATDAGGNVYVAEQLNNRIQKFTSTGAYIARWGSTGSGNGQLNAPFGITVDAAGSLYVAELFNNRIQKFTSNGLYLTQGGGPGSGNGQFSNPIGVATDVAGNVFVCEAGSTHRVQKFVKPPAIALVSDAGSDQGSRCSCECCAAPRILPVRESPSPATRSPPQRCASRVATQSAEPMAIQLAGWTYVTSFAAHGTPITTRLSRLWPTRTRRALLTAFMVRAVTADPFTFYDSGIENGFSIDNLRRQRPPLSRRPMLRARHICTGA